MPNVLLVTHYYSTHRGGVEVVAGELAGRIASNHGCHVIWLASDCDRPPNDLPVGVCCHSVAALNIVEKHFGIPWPILARSALAALWQLIGKADVVHIHDALYPGTAAAALFARLRNKPLVVTQHVGEARYNFRWLTWLHALANRTLGRWVLSGATRCIFISASVQEYFTRFCHFRTESELIFNGVDIAVFSPVSDEARMVLRKNFGISNSTLAFLFVGRFVNKKGLPTIRSLAELFPDIIFLMAGDGPIVPEEWGCANVRVLRGLAGPTLSPLYRMADLLLLPSYSEGLPLVVQESMACGTPVLVCEDAARADPAAKSLMFVEATDSPDTVDRWAKRIRRLREDPLVLRVRRAASADYARRHWSWREAAMRTEAALRAAVAAQ